MPRAHLVQIEILLSLGVTAGFAVLALVVAGVPDAWINLPHRAYWLAAARREETRRCLTGMALSSGCGLLAFLLFLHQRVHQANLDGTHRAHAPVRRGAGRRPRAHRRPDARSALAFQPEAAGGLIAPAVPPDPMRLGPHEIPSNLFLSPLAGYTNLPMRLTLRELGGLDWATTDLVNARSLSRRKRKALQLIETRPADRPLAVQLFGSVPEEMRDAAVQLEALGYASVDINMGCPVRKVVRIGGGSSMMTELGKTAALVRGMVGR